VTPEGSGSVDGLRVLHLINGEHFGGVSRVLLNYATAPNRAAEVTVGIFFAGPVEGRFRAAGIPTARVRMRGRLDVGAARSVLRLVRETKADIIHTHTVRTTLVARVARILGGPPVVTHIHSPAFHETTHALRNAIVGGGDRVLARWTDRFVPVSRALADGLRRSGIPADRISLVFNGIPVPAPPDRRARDEARRDLGLAASDQVVGMVANFRPRKGAEDLIGAIARLTAARPDLHLLLVGESFRDGGADYGEQLEAAIRARGVESRVHLTGFRSDVARVMGALDLFVLPSLFGEGLPMVLLEAMAAEVASIATRVDGNDEVIEDHRTGLLVPPGDEGALAEAIASLLDDPARRTELAQMGRRSVVERFSVERMTAGIDAAYAAVLRARPTSS